MEPPDLNVENHESETEKTVKRRRLGRSFGGRNSSWVPPFATPPSGQKSRGGSTGDVATGIDHSPTTASFSKSSPNSNGEKLMSTPLSSTPRSSHPRSLGSLSSRKRSRGDFKSPMRNQGEKKQEETPESIERENDKLRARLSELDKEISELKDEGLSEDELQLHIQKMHEYNELKDMTQMLLGRIAMFEGVTTRQLHEEMGLGED
ncbi:DNA repair protein SWI5 homolog [Strongylocentrotus purpuratus]|uniref:DNA repair protein SWI5 homolog n=1 Tax=Strongylocentrotus purpuratus TaxID=7668 RepID=A0A7M7GHP0_STRPU|nr:DNA repair protein SWI5 homolog [Strongylocentrotus purpuratus]